MPIFTPEEQLKFEERLFDFYMKIKDHRINHFISPLPKEIMEKFALIKKKLGIKDTL